MKVHETGADGMVESPKYNMKGFKKDQIGKADPS
jgi:hypothetical protein